MSELLSPGVFNQEVPSAVQVVQPVSTSNAGMVGATRRGPTEEAALVTSFEQFTRIFGALIADSRLGMSIAAFFANGGRRAYVVRVMPSDAVLAAGFVNSARRNFKSNVGDGVLAAVTQLVLSPTVLKVPIVAVSGLPGVTFRWRSHEVSVNGMGDSFARALDIVTLTDAVGLFTADMVGKTIRIAGSTTPANDGDFIIASYISPTQITYTNTAPGATEAFPGTWVVGPPTVPENLYARDGTTVLVQDTVGHPAAQYEGRVILSMPTDPDSSLPGIAPHETMTLHWLDAASAPATMTLTQVGTTLRAAGTTVAGSRATLDLVTGFTSIEFAGADVPVVADDGISIQLTFTPMTAVRSISDNGSGVLVNDGVTLTGNGTIAYGPLGVPATYSFTCSVGYLVGDGCPLLVDYDIRAWDLDPISVGDWANDMRLVITGNNDYYDVATDTYTRFNVSVTLFNTATGLYDIMETFEEITFTDPTSVQYFPDVLNDLSDFLSVVEPALNAEGPSTLNGLGRSYVIAGGDALTGSRNVVVTLPDVPIVPRSFSISYTDSGSVTRTITDDGAGNLIGDVDGAGSNTIDYDTGDIDVTVSDPIAEYQLVSAVYRTGSEESSHNDTFSGGTDGTYDAAHYGRSQFTSPILDPLYEGVYALNRIEELMQVIIPDFAGDVQITKDLLDYADGRQTQPAGGDRFIILVVPQGSTAQEAVNWVRFDLNQYSKYSAIYWPWVRVADPLSDNRPMVFPPLGHLAGIYARTDSTRNVAKAPAGTVDGALKFLIGLEALNSQGERDLVYPNRINPMISSPQTGLCVWGTRTLSLDSSWRYVPTTRLFMFVEKSVFNSTHWIVFEPNGPGLWARIKAQIQGFLLGLFTDGLFAGSTPSQAFFVLCDESNNDQASIDAGRVNIDIGIAPTRPAEFVVFRYQQKTLES
jgi:phage tail sheath protein FI